MRKAAVILFRLIGGLLVTLLLITGGIAAWYYYRPQPAPDRIQIAPGIEYERMINPGGRTVVVHVATIQLDTEGITFLVTPPVSNDELPLRAKTVSDFLDEQGLTLAINGDFFSPWHDNAPWDYSPHPAEPCQPSGLAISRGETYHTGDGEFHTLYLSAKNEVSFNEPDLPVWNAVSGNWLLIEDGKVNLPEDRHLKARHPRTLVGYREADQTMYWVVVDGRQPNYSEGFTPAECVEFMQGLGVDYALNLDGGGSSIMVMAGDRGPELLSKPICHRIPGHQRDIANHLGLVTE